MIGSLHDDPPAWVDIGLAASLERQSVVSVDLQGDEWVVWRSGSGALCAMDARCPHQWSHLGAEGHIDGEEIVCTAHWWRFDRNGRGSKMSAHGRRDEKASVAVRPCRERNGRIEVLLSDVEDID